MYNVTTRDNSPPCKLACPIHTDAREYIQLIAERKYEEAYASIRRLNPLPRVCGRICTHPCEGACKRGQVDQPMAIRALKRFASDGPWKDPYRSTVPSPTGHKVAVIGSGPAGLAAAQDLALLGHQVTVFEALPALGGMLTVGVPEYRLPRDVVEEEIRAIADLGVVMKTGVRIGKEVKLADLFDQQFEAVFVAVGAHKDRKLGIPGEDTFDGVVSAVSFLRASKQGEDLKVGSRVAVIGGGNTAIDSARSALRLGASSVDLLYRRSRDEMPAAPEEIEAALHEGVQMSFLTAPIEILGEDGKVSALKCIRNELGEPDARGRKNPRPLAGSEFVFPVDMVIGAVGQAPESAFLAEDLALDKQSHRIIVKEPLGLSTTRPGVFAGGDAVTGPATAVEAIAAGKGAAHAIDLYLRQGAEPVSGPAESYEKATLSSTVVEKTMKFLRSSTVTIPDDRRLRGFEEVECPFTEDLAVKEALRCLHCYLGARIDKDRCVSCLTCVRVCPLQIPKAGKMGEITIDAFDCQACGMCALECPVQAIDMDLHSRSGLFRQIQEAVSGWRGPDPLIVGFFDLHGNFGATNVERLRQDHPQIAPVMVFGLGRVDTADILRAFELGADAVFLAGCPTANDPFPEVRERVRQRMARAADLVGGLGLDKGRLEMCHMPEQGLVEEAFVDSLFQRIKQMAPNPLRAGEDNA